MKVKFIFIILAVLILSAIIGLMLYVAFSDCSSADEIVKLEIALGALSLVVATFAFFYSESTISINFLRLKRRRP